MLNNFSEYLNITHFNLSTNTHNQTLYLIFSQIQLTVSWCITLWRGSISPISWNHNYVECYKWIICNANGTQVSLLKSPQLNNDIFHIKWDELMNEKNIDKAYKCFYRKIQYALAASVGITIPKPTQKYSLWHNQSIIWNVKGKDSL